VLLGEISANGERDVNRSVRHMLDGCAERLHDPLLVEARPHSDGDGVLGGQPALRQSIQMSRPTTSAIRRRSHDP